MIKPSNMTEAEGHNFLLAEIAYIGPIFANFGPDGRKEYFAVSLHSGISFYLEPSHHDDLLRRWQLWQLMSEADDLALLRRAALYARADCGMFDDETREQREKDSKRLAQLAGVP